MKNRKEFNYCEYCDAALEIISPPSEQQYENALIEIRGGSLLLPAKIVKKNRKEGVSDSHVEYLDGFYCGPECLRKRIMQILHK